MVLLVLSTEIEAVQDPRRVLDLEPEILQAVEEEPNAHDLHYEWAVPGL
jgi:hypothetical protein